MARRERRHWWYAGMRRVALAVLERTLTGQRDLQILDAGCGTGGTTIDLRRFGRVTAVDLAWEAVAPARGRGLTRVAQASIEHLPFGDAMFDLATSFEVLYHLGVANDAAALSEIGRVLKPGGRLLLRVPAHDWLRGEHDRLVHTAHRYARDEIEVKLAQAGFAVEWVSWANTVLFPVAAAKRLLERSSMPPELTRGDPAAVGARASASYRGGNDVADAAEPDLWQPPGLVNALLESTVAIEALAIPRGMRLPFGLSLLALARAT